MSKTKPKKSAFREWIDALLFAVVAASLIRWILLEPFTIPTASMEKNGYAYYRDWIDCVYDYGFYSCCNLSEVNSEEEYYSVLTERYAEDPTYIEKLKDLINREKLKKLFED